MKSLSLLGEGMSGDSFCVAMANNGTDHSLWFLGEGYFNDQ